jgi:hypothetical protein
MKVMKKIGLIVLLFVSIFITGCINKNDDTKSEFATNEELIQDINNENREKIDGEIVYSSRVKQDVAGELKGDTFVAKQADSGVKVGDIILLYGNNVLAAKKVVNKNYNIMKVENAPLEEVFAKIELAGDVEITEERLIKNSTPRTVRVQNYKRQKRVINGTVDERGLRVDIIDHTIIDYNGARVAANGYVFLKKPEVNFKFEGFSDKFTLKARFEEEAKIDLTGNYSFNFARASIPLGKYSVPIVVYGAPIGSIDCELLLHIDANGNITFSAKVDQSAYADLEVKSRLFSLNDVDYKFDYLKNLDDIVRVDISANGSINADAGISPRIDLKLLQYSVARLEGDFGVKAGASFDVGYNLPGNNLIKDHNIYSGAYIKANITLLNTKTYPLVDYYMDIPLSVFSDMDEAKKYFINELNNIYDQFKFNTEAMQAELYKLLIERGFSQADVDKVISLLDDLMTQGNIDEATRDRIKVLIRILSDSSIVNGEIINNVIEIVKANQGDNEAIARELLKSLKEEQIDLLIGKLEKIAAIPELSADMKNSINKAIESLKKFKEIYSETYDIVTQVEDIINNSNGDMNYVINGIKNILTEERLGKIKVQIEKMLANSNIDEATKNRLRAVLDMLIQTKASYNSVPVTNVPSENKLLDARVFDLAYYKANYADLRNAFGNNDEAYIQHWLDYGIKEGRQASEEFSSITYINRYPDLKNAFGNNYELAVKHYIDYGIGEGRTAR